MKEVDVSSLEHTSWRCQCHVVFAPKYRRMEIYGKIKEDIGIILRKLCQQVDTVGSNKKAIKADIEPVGRGHSSVTGVQTCALPI